MPTLDRLIKDKIDRATSSALRREVSPVAKQLREVKREVSRLSKANAALAKQVARLTSEADKNAAGKIRASEAETDAARIGPRSIASTRKKLKLGRREFGLLAGVTGNAVYLWETGESRPSGKSRAALVGLRKIGVKDARSMLQGMEE